MTDRNIIVVMLLSDYTVIYFSFIFRFMKNSRASKNNFSQVERKVLIFIQIPQNSASWRCNYRNYCGHTIFLKVI